MLSLSSNDIQLKQAAADKQEAIEAMAAGLEQQGLWLAKSTKDVSKTALAFVTPATAFEEQGKPVKGLVMVAACNGSHLENMNYLAQLLYKQQVEKLISADAEKVVSLLTQEVIEGKTDVFKIRNPHGLHARPGAMLVSVAKKFDSNILVSNLHDDGKAVNAKSLMKVIALGVKQSHELQFTAQGEDAELALAAIGQAIADGLGEDK